jgi:small-conductance mechanosensitive channel
MHIDFAPALQAINGMARSLLHSLPYLAVALFIYGIFHLIARGVRRLITQLVARRHYNISLVIGRLVQAGIITAGVLVALVVVVPSFSVGQVVQLLGISSVAIGFAFRDILQNFLAGILLIITQPFRIGDQIVVAGFEGRVEDIETRATFLRTYDGRRVVIPNSTLFTGSVTVNTAYRTRRDEHDIHIDGTDDVERTRKLILQAVQQAETVLKDPPPEVLVVDIVPTGTTFRARWWFVPPDEAMVSRDKVLSAIQQQLDRNRPSSAPPG